MSSFQLQLREVNDEKLGPGFNSKLPQGIRKFAMQRKKVWQQLLI